MDRDTTKIFNLNKQSIRSETQSIYSGTQSTHSKTLSTHSKIPSNDFWLRRVSENFSRYILRQVLDGLSHCNDVNYIHKDLKPDSVYITKSFVVKLGDFYLSERVKKGAFITENVKGVAKPINCKKDWGFETKRLKDRKAFKIDILGIGVIAYYMVAKALPPFPEFEKNNETTQSNSHKAYNFDPDNFNHFVEFFNTNYKDEEERKDFSAYMPALKKAINSLNVSRGYKSFISGKYSIFYF